MSGAQDPDGPSRRAARRAGRSFVLVAALAAAVPVVILLRAVAGARPR